MNMNVSLTEELARFVKAKVETGRYGSSSEVVREALRLLERKDRAEEAEIARLRQAWDDGIASGDAGPLDIGGIIRDEERTMAASGRG
jgi:antitoxin ParD1/3/4